MKSIDHNDGRRVGRSPAILAALAVPLLATAPANGFERAMQADYDQLAFCYGQQVGAANALADDHEHWRAAYPQPDARMAEGIGMVLAHAVELSTLADTTAALYEDLDHPGYGMNPVSANAAYAEGYAFWEAYMAIPFDTRVLVELTDDLLGMSPQCWQTTFAIEGLHAANAASGQLVWAD